MKHKNSMTESTIKTKQIKMTKNKDNKKKTQYRNIETNKNGQ